MVTKPVKSLDFFVDCVKFFFFFIPARSGFIFHDKKSVYCIHRDESSKHPGLKIPKIKIALQGATIIFRGTTLVDRRHPAPGPLGNKERRYCGYPYSSSRITGETPSATYSPFRDFSRKLQSELRLVPSGGAYSLWLPPLCGKYPSLLFSFKAFQVFILS